MILQSLTRHMDVEEMERYYGLAELGLKNIKREKFLLKNGISHRRQNILKSFSEYLKTK